MANPRPRSAGFVVLDIRTGEVLSPLYKRREPAREEVRAYYAKHGGPFTTDEISARGLRHLGVHQVMLYPGETFDPTQPRDNPTSTWNFFSNPLRSNPSQRDRDVWEIFESWYRQHGHWVYRSREHAIETWRTRGIDGLPPYPRSLSANPTGRVIYYWFDPSGEQPASRRGDSYRALVKTGQRPSAAVAQALNRRLGADVQLWPTGSGYTDEYRAQWYDARSEVYREGSVEIVLGR